jgi:hypothetical protein
VGYCDSPEVWAELTKHTKRCSVDLRLELLQSAADANFTPTRKRLLILYLLEFFNDVSSAETPKKDEFGRSLAEANHPFGPSYITQNVAAAVAGRELELEDPPGKDDPKADWTAYRAKVKAAAKKFLGQKSAPREPLPSLGGEVVIDVEFSLSYHRFRAACCS